MVLAWILVLEGHPQVCACFAGFLTEDKWKKLDEREPRVPVRINANYKNIGQLTLRIHGYKYFTTDGFLDSVVASSLKCLVSNQSQHTDDIKS